MNWLSVIAVATVLGLLAALNERRQGQGEGAAWQGDALALDPEYQTAQPDAFWSLAPPVIEDGPEQLPSVTETFIVTASEAASAVGSSIAAAVGLAAPQPDQVTADRNVRAFLDMIAFSDGTAGPDGSRTLFGGGVVASLVDHPRQYFPFTNARGEQLKTSAAGRYQFLERTWNELAAKLQLPDFSPASQDAAAIELIRQRGALADVRAGRLQAAIAKVSKVWASLPGAGYAQPERKYSALQRSYEAAGGNLEA